MDIPNTTVILILAVVVILFLVIRGCGDKKKRDGFSRTPLTNCTNCKFVRTPVDFAFKDIDSPIPNGWRSNPHYIAEPTDKAQPLGFGPIDFWADSRKLDNGTLWEQYGNNYVGGDKQTYIVNDTKTRSMLSEVGDLTMRRILDSQPANSPLYDGPIPNPMRLQKIIEASEDPEGAASNPMYGGNRYLKRQIGT